MRPGEVCASGLDRIRKKLASLLGGQIRTDQRVLSVYYETLLKSGLAQPPPVHHEREMRTIAAALDELIEGNLQKVGDLLMGRFKALEEALLDGTWDFAREYEVLPQREVGITTDSERHRAAALQMRTVRLRAAMASVRSRGSAQGR